MKLIVILFLCSCATNQDPIVTAPMPSIGAKVCGAIDIPCNCNGTIAYNGKISDTTHCQSGKHQWHQCIGDCWEAKCYCN